MQQVDNDLYHELGEKWYFADDHPIALLRAESRLRNPWILQKLESTFKDSLPQDQTHILDVGCGAGFLSNYLAKQGYHVQGVDLSDESLNVARAHDQTGNVGYSLANASQLPFKDNCFDAVMAMDFLEHVEQPEMIVAEISRVLRPGGVFFFHTFNRNFISWLVIIKAVEVFVKNTPPHLHLLSYFIKPNELDRYCQKANLQIQEFRGLKPNLFTKGTISSFLKREVPKDFSFSFTPSLLTSYSGYAIKNKFDHAPRFS